MNLFWDDWWTWLDTGRGFLKPHVGLQLANVIPSFSGCSVRQRRRALREQRKRRKLDDCSERLNPTTETLSEEEKKECFEQLVNVDDVSEQPTVDNLLRRYAIGRMEPLFNPDVACPAEQNWRSCVPQHLPRATPEQWERADEASLIPLPVEVKSHGLIASEFCVQSASWATLIMLQLLVLVHKRSWALALRIWFMSRLSQNELAITLLDKHEFYRGLRHNVATHAPRSWSTSPASVHCVMQIAALTFIFSSNQQVAIKLRNGNSFGQNAFS